MNSELQSPQIADRLGRKPQEAAFNPQPSAIWTRPALAAARALPAKRSCAYE